MLELSVATQKLRRPGLTHRESDSQSPTRLGTGTAGPALEKCTEYFRVPVLLRGNLETESTGIY
jgi:hypothetical protein